MLHCILGTLYTLLGVAIVCAVIAVIAWAAGWPVGDPTSWPTGRWGRVIIVLVGLIIAVLFIACVLGEAPPWFGKGWVPR